MRLYVIVALMLVLGGCKFDPVKSFQSHVDASLERLSALPCEFEVSGLDDIIIEKTKSITKPWIGSGVRIEFGEFCFVDLVWFYNDLTKEWRLSGGTDGYYACDKECGDGYDLSMGISDILEP